MIKQNIVAGTLVIGLLSAFVIAVTQSSDEHGYSTDHVPYEPAYTDEEWLDHLGAKCVNGTEVYCDMLDDAIDAYLEKHYK